MPTGQGQLKPIIQLLLECTYLAYYQTAIHDCTQHTKHTAETTLFSDYYSLATNSLH